MSTGGELKLFCADPQMRRQFTAGPAMGRFYSGIGAHHFVVAVVTFLILEGHVARG